jgi:3-deoxy-D-manno-octulosonate 8-phosphate phosphatase (KDO 8-P phosphatase)
VYEDGFDSAFGIHSSQDYIWENPMTPAYPLDLLPNSIDLPTTHRECMGIYVTKIESFFRYRNRICGSFKAISVDQFEMVDIDTQEDFDLANAIASGLPRTNEYLTTFGNETTSAPKIVFIDVDGTLTDGSITVDGQGILHRSYSTLDGVAISHVSRKVPVVFITAAKDDESISFRATMLGVESVRFATRDKYNVALEVCHTYGISVQEAMFVGNDYPDIELLNSCGFAFIPADSDLNEGAGITRVSKMSGFGAVREALIHSGLFSHDGSEKGKN